MSNVTPTGEIYGGYGLALTGAVQMRVKWQPNGDANGDLPGSSLTIAAATRYSVMLAFDCRNEVVRTFINGTESALCAMTFPSNSANARYPIIKAAVGCSFGGRSTPSSFAGAMAAGSAINRVLMLKRSALSSDLSADMLAIAQAAYAFPNELPHILRGL